MFEPISSDNEESVLELNNQHAAELSWLDGEKLSRMLSQAFYARRIGNLDGFLLAFAEGADYDSPNYHWFQARHDRFVYVDRIVIAESARGRGLARQLYTDLFAAASAAAHPLIVCEVNSIPPNPASDRFHAAMGFAAVGESAIHGGQKTVRYLVKPVTGLTG